MIFRSHRVSNLSLPHIFFISSASNTDTYHFPRKQHFFHPNFSLPLNFLCLFLSLCLIFDVLFMTAGHSPTFHPFTGQSSANITVQQPKMRFSRYAEGQNHHHHSCRAATDSKSRIFPVIWTIISTASFFSRVVIITMNSWFVRVRMPCKCTLSTSHVSFFGLTKWPHHPHLFDRFLIKLWCKFGLLCKKLSPMAIGEDYRTDCRWFLIRFANHLKTLFY